jgi:RimJ/RimL family protein N-acetyltransferase
MLYSHKTGLSLRKLEKSDLPALLLYKKESWQQTHRISVLNSVDQENWFQRMSASTTTLVMIAEESLERDGLTQWARHDIEYRVGLYVLENMDWQNGTYDMSYGVFSLYRNKGWGSKLVEAGADFGFEVMNFRRVGCEILATNERSMRCVLRAGYEHEGIRKEIVHRCGEKIDSHMYGLLRTTK